MKKLDTSHIPNLPWVYLFKDKKEQILYIWKARNLQKRVNQYFTPWSVWKQEMLLKADHVDFFVVENESESLYLESNLIKKHLPPFNNMLKWANAYAYIKLTKHPVPQVLITRKKINDQNTIRESSKNFFNILDKLFSIEPALSSSSIKKSCALIIILGSAKDDAQNQNSELLNTPISS